MARPLWVAEVTHTLYFWHECEICIEVNFYI